MSDGLGRRHLRSDPSNEDNDMSKTKTETLLLQVPVRVKYDTAKAKKDVLADLKRELFSELSSAGTDGWATAKTMRPKWVKA